MSDKWFIIGAAGVFIGAAVGALLLDQIKGLEAENDRLRSECEATRTKNWRLKAEVEAIRQEYSDATNHYNRLHNNLKAKVKRLTKPVDGAR